MGKSAPTPPPAPDPTSLIDAQTSANQQTALFQSGLNNVNYQGPNGSVSYSMNSPDRWTETVSLDPTQQATYDMLNNAQYRAAKVADNQVLNVGNALQNSNLQAPTLQTGAQVGNLASGYNSGGAIDYGFSPGGSIQPQVAPTYSPFSSLQGGGMGGLYNLGQAVYGGGPPQGASASPGAPAKVSFGSVSPWLQGGQGGGAPPTATAGPSLMPSAASPAGAGAGATDSMGYTMAQEMDPSVRNSIASRLAIWQQPGHASAQAAIAAAGGPQAYEQQLLAQKGFSPQGAAPAASSAPAPASTIQSSPSTAQPQAAPPAQGAGQGASSGIDPTLAAMASNPVLGTQLATYAQAKQMLDPQWSQAAEQQQAQLAAQGLNPNDAAYQNAMTLFGNQQNEAYGQALFNAINAGDAEQNTLFSQNLSSGQFANQAQAQQFGENQGLAQFNNSAQAQANSQNAQAAAFQNAASGQNWQENYQNAQLANQAAQQQFQDQAYAQELPINEFNSLLSNSQVALPASAPAQTSVAAPNVLGAYQLQQSALQNAYDEQMQNYSSGLNGLYGLGNSALNLLPW